MHVWHVSVDECALLSGRDKMHDNARYPAVQCVDATDGKVQRGFHIVIILKLRVLVQRLE